MGNTQSQYFTSGAAAHVPSFTVDSTLDKVLWKRIEETAAIARQAILVRKSLDDLQNILDGFSHVTEAINLRDMSGFSLLQHAIIVNQFEIVQYLLQRGADVNIPTCGRPLHLAAKLGRVELSNLLLEFHADPDVLSCVCYPESHYASQIVCVPQMDHMHLACNGDIYNPKNISKDRFEFPKYYAVVADNVECVKIFEKAQHVSHDSTVVPDLHLACKLGSKECASYYLQQNKDSVNQVDQAGFSPIMHALKWDKALVELLVLNGALLTVKTKSKQTLLHLLLKESSTKMVEMLKYLLDCGLRMNVNQPDSGGNSALNTLLLTLEEYRESVTKTFKDISGNALATSQSKFSRNVLANSSPTLRQVDTGCYEYFTDMEMQYIQCVNLLLKSGLNPNIPNRLGNTSLHIITRLLDNSMGESEISQNAGRYIDLQFIYMLVLAILKAKGNVNIVNSSEQSIISQFVFYSLEDIFSCVQNARLLPIVEHQVEYFISCVKAMHQYGAQLHVKAGRNPSQICYLHALFNILDEFHSASHLVTSETDSAHNDSVKNWASKVLRIIAKIAKCFLDCGLDPNVCIDGTVMQKHFSLLYYKLLTTKLMVDVQEIEDFLCLLMHYGVDIDRSGQHILMTVLRPHTGSGYRQLPCYPLLHLINMIGTKSHNPKHEPELLALVHFFYNALSEDIARQCVRLYLEYDRCLGAVPKYREFDAYLVQHVSSPRKLKQLSAKFVYRELAKRKMSIVRLLPIPIVMQNYVGSFHY